MPHGSAAAQVRVGRRVLLGRLDEERAQGVEGHDPRRDAWWRSSWPRCGPSGWYSKAWMSRADQSLSSTAPNTWRSAWSGSISAVGGPPTRKPTSSSKSSWRRRHEPGRPVGRVGHEALGPHDRRAADHDRPGPSVVGDGEVPPVGQQRLAAGPQDAPEVGGVVERRVEVDEVDDRRAAAARATSSIGCTQLEALGAGEELADLVADHAAPAAGHQGVERRAGR